MVHYVFLVLMFVDFSRCQFPRIEGQSVSKITQIPGVLLVHDIMFCMGFTPKNCLTFYSESMTSSKFVRHISFGCKVRNTYEQFHEVTTYLTGCFRCTFLTLWIGDLLQYPLFVFNFEVHCIKEASLSSDKSIAVSSSVTVNHQKISRTKYPIFTSMTRIAK